MNLELLKQYEQDGWIYSQTHPTLPLTIYNYSDKTQWENYWDEVTLQCRGLVVDDLGNVVARPFRKFFNLSEGKTNITNEYEIYTKYDGSLGILFFYSGEWIFASRGSFTSEQAIKGFELLLKYDYKNLDNSNTYCFEIIYPENKIVVEYNGYEGIILTGVFNTETGEEQDLNCWFLPHARVHRNDIPLHELHKIIDNNEEGYVIRFSNGERCKIKGAEYLRLHRLMSEMSTTAVWECLKNGDSILTIITDFPDEFFNVVSEYEVKLLREFKEASEDIWEEYLKINITLGKVTDKEFAFHVKDSKYKSFFFSLRNGKVIEEQIWRLIKPTFKKL